MRLVLLQEAIKSDARLMDPLGPGVQTGLPLGCNRIYTPSRAGAFGVPCRTDQTLMLHLTQGPIEQAWVCRGRALIPLELSSKLISMRRASGEQQQEPGLQEAAHAPMPRAAGTWESWTNLSGHD